MVRALWFCVLALACAIAAPAAAAPDLFANDAPPLKLVLTARFDDLARNAPHSTDPYPATLSASDGTGPEQSFSIQVRPRGISRRSHDFCEFPPLALEFPDTGLHGTLFHGQKKLKLVTYCRNAADFEQRIVVEYLAYRLFNLMTPMSYRVRPAQVTYRRRDGDAGVTRFGFLIEDTDNVADRNDLDELKAEARGMTMRQLDAHGTARVAVFEYMVSNLDFDFVAGPPGDHCCHNIKLIAARHATLASATHVVPLPYDFDYSGLVDAPYAVTPESLPVNTVTQRLFRGYCQHNGEIASVVAEFQAHHAEMLAVVNNETRLTPNVRNKTTRYLEGFFAIVADPAKVQREIVGRCR